MTAGDFRPLDGGCDCRAVRYRMTAPPLFFFEGGDARRQRFELALFLEGELALLRATSRRA